MSSSFGCSLKQAWGTDCLDACPSSSTTPNPHHKPPRVREIRDNARSYEYPAISPHQQHPPATSANPVPTTMKKRVVVDHQPSLSVARAKKQDPNDNENDGDSDSDSDDDDTSATTLDRLNTIASDRLVRGLLMGGVALFALDAAFRFGQATVVVKKA